MNNLSRLLKKQIQIGYWPGFIVGMYPSQFAYQPIPVDFENIWKGTKEVNLYYHIPFCKWKCSYCTFFSVVENDSNYYEKYIDRLNVQFEFYNQFFSEPVRIKSICFGGGTPNVIPVQLYEQVFNTLTKGKVIFDAELEPSMEISPEILTEDYICSLAAIGIKRLSLGVQSLKRDLRKSINRQKNLNILDIIEDIRKHQLNINIDLISGLLGQDQVSFMDTLNEIVKFSPETISIYPLSGENSSIFKNRPNLMTTMEKYDLFNVYYEYLLNNGYRCESHVKFVRLNNKSTHQQKIYEYKGVQTLGIGCGARSYNNYVHYSLPWYNDRPAALQSINLFIDQEFNRLPWVGFIMNADEKKRRFIIYSFFLGVLNAVDYHRKYGSSIFTDFAEEFNALLENRLVEIRGEEEIVLTQKGRTYTDLIGSLFWSPFIQSLFRGEQPVPSI